MQKASPFWTAVLGGFIAAILIIAELIGFNKGLDEMDKEMQDME